MVRPLAMAISTGTAAVKSSATPDCVTVPVNLTFGAAPFTLHASLRPDVAQDIELHFVGFLRKENKKLIKRLKLEGFVKDHGYMNHSDAIIKIKSSDILWIMVGRKRNIDAILPGKLYEYMGSLKPIIACVPDGAAKIAATEYGASFITEPDDINQI